MKTLTMIIMMIGTMNAFAFAKKMEANFNSSGSTICADRSVGKGNSDAEPASSPSEETSSENATIEN